MPPDRPMSDPVILFVKPKAISHRDKRVLQQVGVVVIEIDDPSAVRLTRAGVDLPTSALLGAAAKAISNLGAYEDVKAAFGKAVCAAILAAKPP